MSSNDACEYQANKFPEIDSEVLDSDTSIDFNWESVTESRKTEKIEGNRSNVAQEIPVLFESDEEAANTHFIPESILESVENILLDGTKELPAVHTDDFNDDEQTKCKEERTCRSTEKIQGVKNDHEAENINSTPKAHYVENVAPNGKELDTFLLEETPRYAPSWKRSLVRRKHIQSEGQVAQNEVKPINDSLTRGLLVSLKLTCKLFLCNLVI